jgi:nitrite reductase/ring-hydroxylating ferredoxin subunit/multimeric flavodoxin WrbA
MSDETKSEWHDLGAADALAQTPLQEVKVGRTRLAVSYADGRFGVISGVCNHVGGPLGQGRMDDHGYVTCPWHAWKFHHVTGLGEPGYEEDRVPSYTTKIEGGRLWVDLASATARGKKPHEPHPLVQIRRRGEPGGPAVDAPRRVLGLSTTNLDSNNPRPSTSEMLLEVALAHAAAKGAETRLIKVRDLSFRACEGYYSKSARACTWPCSITQMDPNDQMDRVYEGVVAWADVILVATPIRWGAASSLYFKMAERMNCIQNQITLSDKVLMQNKVAGFIVTGGQDNIQAVVGQMLTFFGELGCAFPQFPFVGHSRGWSAEDMENNVGYVARSEALRDGTRGLVDRALSLCDALVGHDACRDEIPRGGRKAHALAADHGRRE